MTIKRLIAILCVTLTVAVVGASDHKARGDQLTANEVTINNYRQFEAQLRRDLPIGTCVEDIQTYLTKIGLEHSFNPYRNTIDAGVTGIDRYWLVFITDLVMSFHIDEDEKCLTALEVRLRDMGP